MNKKQIVLALYKNDKNGSKIYELMARDFNEERWRSAASKNAYVLLSKKKYMLCAAFFLISKNIKDCVNILIEYLHDIQLAVLVCRLVEGDKSENLKKIYTDYFIKKGEELDDPYLRLFGYWNTEQYIMALNTLCSKKAKQVDINEELYMSSKSNAENSIWMFDSPRTCKLDYSLYILSKKLLNSYNVKNALEASKPKPVESSIFDDFFDSYTNVSKYITAPAVKVTVNALPTTNKPASFNGTVGHFSLNSNITATETKANEAVTLKLNIAGSGNMKLIKNPVIKFPDGFELYDPKVTNNFKTSPSGVSGTKSIEYLFIPRHSGNFEIPSAEISYFDTQERTYKTLKTPAYKLQVAKGDGNEAPVVAGNSNYVDKQDVKQIGKDIRFIQTERFNISKEEEPVFGTLICWLLYLVPLFVSMLLFIFFRKQAKENANIRLVKNKKANKVAQKRLKQAQKLLNEGNKDSFYEEVLKATWTYLSDKLSIPVASLTKERVGEELTAYKVDSVLINQFIEILNTCEFARFAPNSGQQEMGNLYDDTIQAISNLEDIFRKQ